MRRHCIRYPVLVPLFRKSARSHLTVESTPLHRPFGGADPSLEYKLDNGPVPSGTGYVLSACEGKTHDF